MKVANSWLETVPVSPTYVFCMDISSTAIMNGFFHQSVLSIKQCLDYFQNAEKTEICFVTYDQSIQFYNVPLDPNAEPTIYWAGDVDDPFVPLPK